MQSNEMKKQGLVMRAALVAACLFVATVMTGCGASAVKPTKDAKGRVPVVATNSILSDWVKQVGGDQVVVTTLVPADGDPHTFEPTPRDGLALTKAMLVFENGLHFESWLDELFTASGSLASRVTVSRNITPRKAFCSCHGTSEDPHVFQSVKHAISMVQVIADELGKVDPENAETYNARSKAYIQELEILDSEIRSLVAEVPADQRYIVTAHNTLDTLLRTTDSKF